LIEHLRKFVHDVFDHAESASAKFWTNLEDVFTNIDLTANAGHHLGATHAPSQLRTIGRVLLARMMSMLDERFDKAMVAKGTDWFNLENSLKSWTLSTAHSNLSTGIRLLSGDSLI